LLTRRVLFLNQVANSALATSDKVVNSALPNSALANWDKVQVIDLRNCAAFLFTRVHGKSLSEANLSILEKGYLAPPASPIPGGGAPMPVYSASEDWRFLCQECDFSSELSEGELQELVDSLGVEGILSTDSEVEAALESQAAFYGGDPAAEGSPKDMVHSPFGRNQLVSRAYFADTGESERDIDSQSIEPGPGPYAMVVWLPGAALVPIDPVEADNSEPVSLTAFEAASELEAGGTQIDAGGTQAGDTQMGFGGTQIDADPDGDTEMDSGGTEIETGGVETEVDEEVASILGAPEIAAALDARLPVPGSQVVDLCTPTPDAPGPSAGDKRPAPDSGSQRPNRKAKMDAAAKVAQIIRVCAVTGVYNSPVN
jgi:hypothetical protein